VAVTPLPTVPSLAILITFELPIDTNLLTKSWSWYKLKSYPDKDVSETSNTRSLSLTIGIGGFIKDNSCAVPPTDTKDLTCGG